MAPEVNQPESGPKDIIRGGVCAFWNSFYASMVLACASPAIAQNSTNGILAPVIFTVDQDRENMMHQLGVSAMRPGFRAQHTVPQAP